MIADILWFDIDEWIHNGRRYIYRRNWLQANYLYYLASSDVLLK